MKALHGDPVPFPCADAESIRPTVPYRCPQKSAPPSDPCQKTFLSSLSTHAQTPMPAGLLGAHTQR